MTVLSLFFEDKLWQWTLSQTDFAPFNLLVGASGVGKTRILQSLNRVRLAALRGANHAPGCEWVLRIAVQNQVYSWRAKTMISSPKPFPFVVIDEGEDEEGEAKEDARFVEEILHVEGGPLIFKRDETGIVLNGKPLPRIKDTESAIELFRDEDTIQPINQAMRRFLFSSASERVGSVVSYEKKVIERFDTKIQTLDELRDSHKLDIVAKAMLLQNKFPDEFRRVIDQYREIFVHVDNIRVGPLSEFQMRPAFYSGLPFEVLTIAIRERNISNWLATPHISSGMFRSLIHLLELLLAPAGTVVLIDEFENSLGVNCLPQVAEHILGRSNDLQFLITSHHPYVINNVPPSMWRVVTRHGSTVRVRDHRDLPALNTGSHHDKFTILSNLPEFEQGVE